MRVLISAYACNPDSSIRLHPGEDIKGWRFVGQISRFHDTWIITHAYNAPGINKALKIAPNPRAQFYYLDLPRWMRMMYKIEFAQRIYYYLWQIKAWGQARTLHQKFHFDVAHHLSFGNDWIPSFIGALLPVPFIWGPLGGGQRTPRALMKEYTLYGKFAELSRDIAQWVGRNDFFRRRCLKKAYAILVCNRETKEKIPVKYHNKLYWFPLNGIFPDDIKDRTQRQKGDDRFRVITAGRLHRLKGFGLGIRAFSKFHERNPNSELIIVGKGPERERLKRLTRHLNVEENVRIIPWMSRGDLLRAFCSSDIFLFPSFRDGGGAVVVEAMASGLPVICLDSGGPGFHIKPEWGIKIAPGNPNVVVNKMANALEKQYRDTASRQEMGKAAQKRANEFYLADRLGEYLQHIYLEVLGTSNAPFFRAEK